MEADLERCQVRGTGRAIGDGFGIGKTVLRRGSQATLEVVLGLGGGER